MKKVSLSLLERTAAVSVLNQFKGDLDKLAAVLDDIKEFVITDEEWASVDRKIVNSKGDILSSAKELGPDESGRFEWDEEKEVDKEITMQKATYEYLTDWIKTRNEGEGFSLQDKSFLSLYTKLKDA